MQIARKNKNRLVKKRRIITTALVVLALLVLAYVVYAYTSQSLWPFASRKDTITSQTSADDSASSNNPTNDVNYSPPTKEEEEASQDGKKETTQEDNSIGGSKTHVNIGVTFSAIFNGKMEVRAFTPSIIEGNGTCTATFTKGSSKVTASSSAFIDSSTTQCNPIYIDPSQFTEKGTWDLVVSFSSSDASGDSGKIEVNI